jgi:hypothetical protein
MVEGGCGPLRVEPELPGEREDEASREDPGRKKVEAARFESLDLADRDLRHVRELLACDLSELAFATQLFAEFLGSFHRQPITLRDARDYVFKRALSIGP